MLFNMFSKAWLAAGNSNRVIKQISTGTRREKVSRFKLF